MKKILIACRAYYPDIAGGGEISTKTLAETLIENGYEVSVLAISNQDKIEKVGDVTVYRVSHRNFYWSFDNKGVGKIKKIAWHLLDSNNIFIKKKLESIIDKINPDVLITSTIEDVSSIIWRIGRKKNIRTVHILRSYALLCTNANMFKDDNCGERCSSCSLITTQKRINSKYVDDIVGISDFVLKEHIKYGYFPNAKKHVIYNICLDEEAPKTVTNKNDNIIKIGYLGRVHKTKGIDLVFKAITNLNDEMKGRIEFYIAGTGDDNYIEELKTVASESNIAAVFKGNVKANDFLDSIDLLIVPSKWNEPFGRVVIESLGRNVPVIGKKTGGIPELLSRNKDFLFDTDDELADSITKYIKKEIEFDFDLEEFKSSSIIRKWNSLLA